MQGSDALQQLDEEVLGALLLEATSLFYVGKQVTARTQLHGKADVLLSFKGVKNSDHVRVAY